MNIILTSYTLLLRTYSITTRIFVQLRQGCSGNKHIEICPKFMIVLRENLRTLNKVNVPDGGSNPYTLVEIPVLFFCPFFTLTMILHYDQDKKLSSKKRMKTDYHGKVLLLDNEGLFFFFFFFFLISLYRTYVFRGLGYL